MGRVCKTQRSESLVKLEELTSILAESPNYAEYETVSGKSKTCYGYALHREDAVAVQRAFIKKGEQIKVHIHNELELLLVYIGKMVVTREGEEFVLEIGDSIRIKPGVNHYVAADKDTWMIGITVPAGRGYPDVGVATN